MLRNSQSTILRSSSAGVQIFFLGPMLDYLAKLVGKTSDKCFSDELARCQKICLACPRLSTAVAVKCDFSAGKSISKGVHA